MAHSKLRQKPCAHTKQKHKHMASKTKSPAMCKTEHEHAANEKTHKPRAHTRHDNMKPMKNTSCVPHSTRHNMNAHRRKKHEQRATPLKHTWTEENALSELETAHSDETMRQNMERECPNPNTKPKFKT